MTAQENSELSYTLDEICGHAEDIKRLVERRDELRALLSNVEASLEACKTNLCQYVVDKKHILLEGSEEGNPAEDMSDYYECQTCLLYTSPSPRDS